MSKLSNNLKAEFVSMYANNTIDVFHSNATFTELEEHVHEANDNGFYSIVLNVSPKVIIDDIARYKADAMELSFAKAVLRLYVEYKVFDDDSTEPNLASLRLHTDNPIQIQGDAKDYSHGHRIRFDKAVGFDLAQTLLDTFLEQQGETELYNIIKAACDRFVVHINNIPF